MLIIAHRGGKEWKLGENNLATFRKVIEHNQSAVITKTNPINGIELDIRSTGKDNDNSNRHPILVCVHDPKIAGRLIAQLNYTQLNRLAQSKGLEIPTFEAVLNLCKNKIYLDIEIKESGYELETVNIVKQYLDYEQYIISSFHLEVITTIKQIDYKIKTGWLLSKKKSNLVANINQSQADIVLPHYKLITTKLVETIQQLNKPIYTWTVNQFSMMQKMADLGVSAIITDYPKLAAKYFNRQ